MIPPAHEKFGLTHFATTCSTEVHGSPPSRRPVGRAIDTARFQEVHEVALGDANAVHYPHVPQFAAGTECVDATSRYSEALGHLTTVKKVRDPSQNLAAQWQQKNAKRLHSPANRWTRRAPEMERFQQLASLDYALPTRPQGLSRRRPRVSSPVHPARPLGEILRGLCIKLPV